MTIQELGSLSELIAAVATLATLIYLAIQIRANTTAVKVESRRGSTSNAMQFQGILGENKEAASVFRRGLVEPDSLDPDESIQFTFLFSMLTSQSDNVFDDYRLGVIDQEMMESTTSSTLNLLKTPGGRQHWSNYSSAHTPEFRDYIDQQLNEPSG